MKIQNIYLIPGDTFKVGDDSSTYTFINISKNDRYGFDELNASNEFGGVSSFRIDTMDSNGLFLKKN